MSVDSGTRLLLGPIFRGALGQMTLTGEQKDGSEGSGEHLLLTVEGTAGVAKGVRMSLGRGLCGAAGPEELFLLIPGEKSGLLQETDTWVLFEGSLLTHCSS